jgi:predicted nucleotidyltransferase component of viral defense system
MTKRTFTPAERMHLTELAHAATLAGIMSARRWSPGEIKFQGGTSLHLVYGSPRFSEDLDFIAATTHGLHSALKATAAHVTASFAREYPRLCVTLKVRDDAFVKDPRNPRLFTLTLSEPDWYEAIRVKVEFYLASEAAAAAYKAAPRHLLPLRPLLRVDLPPVLLETADIEEILCDKLHALGGRTRIKERDVFDLWWLCQKEGLSAPEAAALFSDRQAEHLALYPEGKNATELAQALRERALELSHATSAPSALKAMVEAIERWLPTSTSPGSKQPTPNPLGGEHNVRSMLQHAALCAEHTAAAIDASQLRVREKTQGP